MVIDIMDLGIKDLDFSEEYDMNRYKRGVRIFENNNVSINKVDKIDEENIKIEATVQGNYDIYNTTLKIHNKTITNSTCTCEDYYKGNLCKHIIATAFETIEPHNANTLDGIRKLVKRRQEEEKKRLAEERKRIEYERKYYTGLRTIEEFKQNIEREPVNTFDLNQLYQRTVAERKIKPSTLATNVKIEYLAEIENNTLKLSFKIGKDRMYVVSNISELYKAYKNETEIYYGKQLRFMPKRENFTEESQPILDYIIKYAEMIEYTNQYGDYRRAGISNKTIYLRNEDIDDFFNNINKNKDIQIKAYHNETYSFTDERLEIQCIFKKENVTIPQYNYYYWYNEDEIEESEEYVLRLNIENYILLYSKNKIYVFYEGKIYTLDKDKNLTKLFELFKYQDKIIVP